MRLKCEGLADGRIYYSAKERTINKMHFFTLFSAVLRNPSKRPNGSLLISIKAHLGSGGGSHSVLTQRGSGRPIAKPDQELLLWRRGGWSAVFPGLGSSLDPGKSLLITF